MIVELYETHNFCMLVMSLSSGKSEAPPPKSLILLQKKPLGLIIYSNSISLSKNMMLGRRRVRRFNSQFRQVF